VLGREGKEHFAAPIYHPSKEVRGGTLREKFGYTPWGTNLRRRIKGSKLRYRLFSSVGRQIGYRDFVTSLASETLCWDTAFIEPDL
jgi:hypothetical protein